MSNLKTTLRGGAGRVSGFAVLAVVTAMGGLAGGLAGCRGDRSDKPPRQFFPDMDDSPKWKAQSQTDFFSQPNDPDKPGRSMRPAVPGTVAFSNFPLTEEQMESRPAWAQQYLVQRDDYLREDETLYFGTQGGTAGAALGTAKFVDAMPADVIGAGDKAANLRHMLELGQQKFTIYCAVCHGPSGDGKGMVGRQWGGVVANFHDPKYRDRTADQGKDGYIFHVARNGVPGTDGYPAAGDTPEMRLKKQKEMKMPGYAHALSEREAWAVVAYIRALQEAQMGAIGDVPPAEREALEKKRAVGGGGAPGTTGGER